MTTQEISLYPGIMSAIRNELTTVFKEVKMANSAQEAKDTKLVIYPSVVPNLPGVHTLNLSISLLFKDTESKETVAELIRSETISRFGITGGTMAAAVVTGLTLYLFSPVTMPIIGTSQRDDAIEDLEAAIPQILKNLSNDIRGSKKISEKREGGPGLK